MLRRGTSTSPLPQSHQVTAAATTQRRERLDGMIHRLLARQQLQQAMIQGAGSAAGSETLIEEQQRLIAANYQAGCTDNGTGSRKRATEDRPSDWFKGSARTVHRAGPLKRHRSSDGEEDSPIVSFLRQQASKASQQRLSRMRVGAALDPAPPSAQNDPEAIAGMTPSSTTANAELDVINSSPIQDQKLLLSDRSDEERAAGCLLDTTTTEGSHVLSQTLAASSLLTANGSSSDVPVLAHIKKMRLQQQVLQLEEEALLRQLAISRDQVSAASMKQALLLQPMYQRHANSSNLTALLGASASCCSPTPPPPPPSSSYLLGSDILPIGAKITARAGRPGGVFLGPGSPSLWPSVHAGCLKEQQQKARARQLLEDRRDLILLQRLKLHQQATALQVPTTAITRGELITDALLRSLAAAETYNNSKLGG